jgi:hypothetical protein
MLLLWLCDSFATAPPPPSALQLSDEHPRSGCYCSQHTRAAAGRADSCRDARQDRRAVGPVGTQVVLGGGARQESVRVGAREAHSANKTRSRSALLWSCAAARAVAGVLTGAGGAAAQAAVRKKRPRLSSKRQELLGRLVCNRTLHIIICTLTSATAHLLDNDSSSSVIFASVFCCLQCYQCSPSTTRFARVRATARICQACVDAWYDTPLNECGSSLGEQEEHVQTKREAAAARAQSVCCVQCLFEMTFDSK